MNRRLATAAVAVAAGVIVAPHVADYLNPLLFGVAAWAYAAHPSARWLLERRT